jgi:putative adenylate-forming enzyme
MSRTLPFARTFARTRWGLRFRDRAALLRWQEKEVARFLARHLASAPYYREYAGCRLDELPVVDKGTMLAHFEGFNTRGISLERASAAALAAEESRDFTPTLDGLTVGLSSGTSGTRGVFLVSPEERARWAGILLARLLSAASLRHLLSPSRPPLRVAFFLRANSTLYTTLDSRRLGFVYHDLLEPWAGHLERLNAQPCDVLVAPPTVLRRLADAAGRGELRAAPRQVLSVAEVLEEDDARAVMAAFGVPAQQVYQCTEGFLGYSCRMGRVHLNEEYVHVEPEWLDAERRRFHPIVTDFSRHTQLVVRYRLDDVLRVADDPCPCGRVSLSLAAIDGRADDVLWATRSDGFPVAVFPDVIRRAFAMAGAALRDYRIEQHGDEWRVRIDGTGPAFARVRGELERLCRRLDVRLPVVSLELWRPEPLDEKRRRIRCVSR